MLDEKLARTIQAIHDAPPRLVYIFAGAGSLALHWLHAVAGSSRTVLEARDCYAPRSLAEVVQGAADQAVSATVAVVMARWAADRAAQLATDDWPLIGVACTAAIATDRARRGDDRAVVALSAGGATRAYKLTMVKALRERGEQEVLVSRLVILATARGCGVPDPALELLDGEELLEL